MHKQITVYLALPYSPLFQAIYSPETNRDKIGKGIESHVSYTVITIQIIEGCIQNDRKCQRVMYAYCYPILLKVCARYAGITDDVQEMTNTCFVKVIKNLHTLSDVNTLGGWVKQIAVNTSIDMFRSGKKYRERNRFTIDTEFSSAANNHVGFDHTESKMDSDVIFQAIRELPDTTREVINLFAIDGLSHREIAQQLDISEEASRWHLHKARNVLADKLTKLNYSIKRSNHGQRS